MAETSVTEQWIRRFALPAFVIDISFVQILPVVYAGLSFPFRVELGVEVVLQFLQQPFPSGFIFKSEYVLQVWNEFAHFSPWGDRPLRPGHETV